MSDRNPNELRAHIYKLLQEYGHLTGAVAGEDVVEWFKNPTKQETKLAKVIVKQREAEATRDELLEARKVVSFASRAPYDQKPAQEPSEDALEASDVEDAPVAYAVDDDAVETLEMALEQARKGGVRGTIVLLGLAASSDPEIVTDVQTMISFEAADEAVQIFLGGLETTKVDLIGLHDDIAFEVSDEN